MPFAHPYFPSYRLLLRAACLLWLVFMLPAGSFGTDEQIYEREKIEVEEGITSHRININRLEQGIASQHQQIAETIQKERVVLADIEEIDLRLQKQVERLGELEVRMADQASLIDEKEEEIALAKGRRDKVKEHLRTRINAYYKMGRIGIINVAFSAQTFPDFLKFHDSFQGLIKYDKEMLDVYKQAVSGLEKARKSLVLEQGLLDEFVRQAKVEKENLNLILLEKNNLLEQIRGEADLHKKAIAEMKEAARELTASLMELEIKKDFLDQGFLLHKGKLEAPVEGEVIARFNQLCKNKLGVSRRIRGIAIDAADNAKIKAVYDGVVVYSGYQRGYGNTVIINHGHDFFTVTSRLEKIMVSKGQEVKIGELIGFAGDTATLVEDGVYFEIRKRKKSLNPLKWLDRSKIIIGKKKPDARGA